MSNYSEQFESSMDQVFPGWRKYASSGMLGRFMDDNTESGIPYQEILNASSLAELKAKASIIKMKHDLYTAYNTGGCYTNKAEAKKMVGCPRIWAQCANNQAALDAFPCYGVFCIPDCPKFKTGECWKRFDELGFKM